MIAWLQGWWETFWIWWHADPETWAILTEKGHDPEDFEEAPRP